MQQGEEKKRLTNGQKHEKIQAVLESYRQFDYEYIPSGEDWITPDERFAYRKKFPESLVNGFWRTVMQIFGPLIIKFAYGAKVTGRKNLKAVKGKGAMCVCNHFCFLDTLFVRQAVGHYRSFHTMGERNNKGGIGGHIIRHGGMLPFSSNFTATKNLIKEMHRLIDNGKIINFYAEQAMWVNYRKPRPMKEGVFTYAVKFDAPVIPIFCTFKRNARGHMKKLRINILPVVFPDESLDRKARAEKMHEETEEAWYACYEREYGKPLEYLPDQRTNINN